MKGKTWNEVKDTEQGTEFKLYAAKDAQHCLDLYETFGNRMSAVEKFLSKHTIEAGWHGINVNTEMVDKGLNALDWIRIKAIEHMPWKTDGDYTSDVLSVTGLAKTCREAGIEVPPSTSEDDPGCQLWEETYGEKFPWVGAMRDWRKANMLLQKMHILYRRRRPDGTMPFGLKYFGAHTGRWSGDSKFNLQNLPRDPCFGVGRGRSSSSPTCPRSSQGYWHGSRVIPPSLRLYGTATASTKPSPYPRGCGRVRRVPSRNPRISTL
jgi:hypothetical protein